MNDEMYVSRFITVDDPHSSRFLFDLPATWWSRPYEYCWAERFAGAGMRVLDAACGIEHPFKMRLAQLGCVTHACDIDERILSRETILAECENGFGKEQMVSFDSSLLDSIAFSRSYLNALPYESDLFDVVYCISVLEHLIDVRNATPVKGPLGSPARGPREIRDSLLELKRVLRPEGLLVLTFDFPRINLAYFRSLVPRLGLRFAGPQVEGLPTNALYSPSNRLYAFRAVLRKVDDGGPGGLVDIAEAGERSESGVI